MNTLSGGDAGRSPDNEDSRLEMGRKIDAPSSPTQQAIEAARLILKRYSNIPWAEPDAAKIIQAAIDAAVKQKDTEIRRLENLLVEAVAFKPESRPAHGSHGVVAPHCTQMDINGLDCIASGFLPRCDYCASKEAESRPADNRSSPTQQAIEAANRINNETNLGFHESEMFDVAKIIQAAIDEVTQKMQDLLDRQDKDHTEYAGWAAKEIAAQIAARKQAESRPAQDEAVKPYKDFLHPLPTEQEWRDILAQSRPEQEPDLETERWRAFEVGYQQGYTDGQNNAMP